MTGWYCFSSQSSFPCNSFNKFNDPKVNYSSRDVVCIVRVRRTDVVTHRIPGFRWEILMKEHCSILLTSLTSLFEGVHFITML